MKRTSIFKRLIALVFALTVVYTVSVKEVHYLFSQHQVHEHCENHLHSDEHQEDCSVCKFDISLFTDVLYTETCINHEFLSYSKNRDYHSVLYSFSVLNISLRGPPALAWLLG
ncbi:MAG: hypothetical protein U0T74_09900 [Chitinophagales bacterium]